jgi:hypothetical protein
MSGENCCAPYKVVYAMRRDLPPEFRTTENVTDFVGAVPPILGPNRMRKAGR